MLSHFKGLPGPPLVEHTIGQALCDAAEQWGTRGALISVHQDIRFVDSFPMTVTGKVQKFVIRETMVAELQQVINVPNPA